MSHALILGIAADRWVIALLLLVLWVAASWLWLRPRHTPLVANADTLIAYATQTGTAQSLAQSLDEQVRHCGKSAALAPLHEITAETLNKSRRLILFAATTGIGETPEAALEFERKVMSSVLDLSNHTVLVLALGDRRYEHFCAFGRRIGDWAQDRGATTAVIEVDDLAASDLARWDELLEANDLPAISREPRNGATPWHVQSREWLCDGDDDAAKPSRAGALYRIVLKSSQDTPRPFEIGDLFEWHGADGARRDFSIASLPGDGQIELFVRRVELADGRAGKASEALTMPDASSLQNGRTKSFAMFHETAGEGPLLAIAAGSGWAGVRSHILGAFATNRPVWLIYGDRGPNPDIPLFEEMRNWSEQGKLHRLDLALSRSTDSGARYVQDILELNRDALAQFLGDNGKVVLCGAQNMGNEAKAALSKALSPDWINEAKTQLRWREALY